MRVVIFFELVGWIKPPKGIDASDEKRNMLRGEVENAMKRVLAFFYNRKESNKKLCEQSTENIKTSNSKNGMLHFSLEMWKTSEVHAECDKDLADAFHLLKPVAAMYLGMQAGGAPSECVFSRGTDIVTKKRNALGADTVEMTVISRGMLERRDYEVDDLFRFVLERNKEENGENPVQNSAVGRGKRSRQMSLAAFGITKLH